MNLNIKARREAAGESREEAERDAPARAVSEAV